MPYEIRKDGPSSKPFCVYNSETGDRRGCSKTKAEAKKFKQVLDMREHGVPPKKKEEEMETSEEKEVPKEKEVLEAVGESAEDIPVAPMTLTPSYVERLEGLTGELLRQKAEHTPAIEPLPESPMDQALLDVAKETAEGPVPLSEVLDLHSELYGEELPVEEKAQSEREKLQAAQKARAGKYNISVKDANCHLTPPSGYPTAESEYGDPVCYRWPADAAHAKPAVGYFNQSGAMGKGGYSSSEWAIVGKRLASLVSRHLPGTYTYSSGKLQKKEEKALEQMYAWVKSIWERICGKDTLPSIFITKSLPDGTHRWVSISSTAFKDHEGEIVSIEAISKSITRADESNRYGPLLFWHTPIQLGSCDYQAQDGVCLVESGLWDDGPVAKSTRECVTRSPSAYGKSIGFLPLSKQEGVIIKGATVNRIWTDLQIVERSILPSSEAASLFTQIMRGQAMEQKKKDALVELIGEELAEEVLSRTKEINEKATQPDAIFKESTEADLTNQTEGEKAQESAETKEKEVDADTTKELPDDILIAVKALREQLETLTAEVKTLQESSGAPRITRIARPSLEPSDDGSETKDTDEGTTPRVVQAIGSAIGSRLGR